VYSFAAGGGSEFTFSTCGSSLDTFVRIFDSDWNEVEGCDDCGDCGVQTVLSYSFTEAGSYYVVVEGYSNEEGSYQLSMESSDGNGCDSAPTTSEPTPAPSSVAPSQAPSLIPTINEPTPSPSQSPTTTPVFENVLAHLASQTDDTEQENLALLTARFWKTVQLQLTANDNISSVEMVNVAEFEALIMALGLDRDSVMLSIDRLVDAAGL